MKNIHAFTEITHSAPGYVSVNEEAGRITVSVRTRGAQTAGIIEMNRDQLEALHSDVGTYLAATAPVEPAPVAVAVAVTPKASKSEAKDAA